MLLDVFFKNMIQKLSIIFLIVFTFPSFGQNKFDSPWDEKSCSEIYKSIGFFVVKADKEWKKDNIKFKQAAFYASIAADYATIYQTVCRKKNKNPYKRG